MGIRTILIPADNMRDIRELDPMVAKEVKFIPCSTLDDVLRVALAQEREMEYDLSDTATDEKKEENKIVLPTSKGKRIYGTI